MTALTKDHRNEILIRVLTETFKPKFDAIGKQVQIILRDYLAKEHPQFISLLNDPISSTYIATVSVDRFFMKIDEERFLIAYPRYGTYAIAPANGKRYGDPEVHFKLRDFDTRVPAGICGFDVTDKKLFKAYTTTWGAYTEACAKLSALLYSYTSREKFVADFPEFAKYLPHVATKVQLPVVIVKDVRRALGKLGIPQGGA